MLQLRTGIIIRRELFFGIVFDTNKNVEKLYNEISIDILNLCDGEHEVDQIIDEIEKLYDADRDTIQKDVLEFVKEQIKNGIIEDIRE